MGRKLIIILIMLLAIVTSVQAICQVNLFDEELAHGDTMQIAGNPYQVNLGGNYNSASISDQEGKKYLLALHDCRRVENFNICLTDITNNDEGEDVARIRVDKFVPSIEIDRTFSQTKFLIGQIATIDLIAKNSGCADVENMVFTDIFSPLFIVKSADGCTPFSGGVKFQLDHFIAGKEKACRYTIQAVENGTLKQEAKASYEIDGDTDATVMEQKLTVTGYSLNIVINSPKKPLNLTDIGWFNITVSNPQSRSIDAKLDVEIPQGLAPTKEIGKLPRFQKYFRDVMTLKPGGKSTLTFGVKPLKSGSFQIGGLLRFADEGIFVDRPFGAIVEVSEPKPILSLAAKGAKQSGTSAPFTLTVYNPTSTLLRAIEVELTSPLFGNISGLGVARLEQENFHTLYEGELEFPASNITKNHTFGFTIKFINEYNELRREFGNFTLSVAPSNNTLEPPTAIESSDSNPPPNGEKNPPRTTPQSQSLPKPIENKQPSTDTLVSIYLLVVVVLFACIIILLIYHIHKKSAEDKFI